MAPDFPLHTGSDEAFSTVHGFLATSGYTERFLLSHFKLPSIHFLLYPYGLQADYLRKKYEEGDSLALFLSRLLLAGETRERGLLIERLGEPVVQAMEELHLLIPGDDQRRRRCPVLVHPAFDLFIASDRGFRPEGPGYRGKDYVMSGAEHICRQFLAHVSQAPCASFLDMGTGSGLAALLGTKFAENVSAVDITPRAAHYARFNARLNLATNVDVLEGDLFAPVMGITFDRIASNPPFEPPLKDDMIFSVGGADGEAIIARLVAEVPQHLKPGGRLYAQVCGTDREGESFDQRVTRWLGVAAGDCDTALFLRLTMKPNEYAIQQILGENQDAWKLQEWNMFYHKLKATEVVVGHLVVQKRKEDRPTFHIRRAFGLNTSLPEMEWLMKWESFCAGPQMEAAILQSRPEPGVGWELHVRHAMREATLTPQSYTFFTTYPFEVNLHVPAWMAMLVSRCDGKQTGAGHYEFFRLKMNLPKEDFLRSMGALIGSGFLRIEEWAPPRERAS